MKGARYLGFVKNLQSGLSLLELLVVMVLTSLTATLLMQGFGFATSVYGQVVRRQGQAQIVILSNYWFRTNVENLIASNNEGESLVGDNQSFEASSLQPLLGKAGNPTRISWVLQSRGTSNALLYKEGDAELLVESGLKNIARFQYQNSSGKWFDKWPVDRTLDYLPEAVRIYSPDDVTEGPRVVKLQMRLVPDLLINDAFLQ